MADRVRQFDAVFNGFADSLKDFTPFFPLEGIIRFIDDWARDGLLLIGDAAHTMSPAGAIGVNVALATAAVAAQEIYPRLGRGPISRTALQAVQRQREDDVRTLHRLQLRAQRVLISQDGRSPVLKWLVPRMLPWCCIRRSCPKCSGESSSVPRCRRWTRRSVSGRCGSVIGSRAGL